MKEPFGDKIEKKLSKYAIENLSLYMVICFGIGFIIEYMPGLSHLMGYMTLEPSLILKGQVWRLVTWVISSPNDNLLWILVALYFYYSVGRTLEAVWGTYRYNVFIFSGVFYTIVGAFIMYGVLAAIGLGSFPIGSLFSVYYVCMSIFLAYAATFPDREVLFMFIIPIKVKVLGVIYAILMIASCLQGGFMVAVPIIASLFNFMVFFFTGRKRIGISYKQQMRRKEFRTQIKTATRVVTKHKCAICGKTDESHPDLEFRFCSKCNGNYEYCQDHLFTHKHVE